MAEANTPPDVIIPVLAGFLSNLRQRAGRGWRE
jgi:hypothetical protein